jgi:hypothetical protein
VKLVPIAMPRLWAFLAPERGFYGLKEAGIPSVAGDFARNLRSASPQLHQAIFEF